MSIPRPLDPALLRRRCDPTRFEFTTTAELPDLISFVGQDRAIGAMNFGLGIHQDGYNIFVLGPNGTGRFTLAREHVDRRAAQRPPAAEWCYVNNFESLQRPRALRLPSGRGRLFRQDVETLIREVTTALPAAFEGEEYRVRRQALEDDFREAQNELLSKVRDEARSRSISLLQTPSGATFAPVRNGEVIAPEDFQKLSEEEQTKIRGDIEDLGQKLQAAMQSMPKRARTTRESLDALNREVVRFTAGSLIEDLMRDYADVPAVADYLKRMLADLIEHAELFLAPQGQEGQDAPQRPRVEDSPAMRRYGVNLLVESDGRSGAPVVYEDNPTYQNLTGEIEHVAQMGTLVTDYRLLKAGSLHRANGGYLLVDARKLLVQPYAWEGLKRALRSKRLKIESLAEIYSMVSTVSLEPEPIPLDVKVVLIGDHFAYSVLQRNDPEFFDLFKVTVELDDQMPRSNENNLRLARLLGTFARREHLRPLARNAVARVIDEAAREADDAERLTTRIRMLGDLVREADYWAGSADRDVIQADDVERAITERTHRSSRIRERVQEQILRETILIDTAGARAGQINGLSVLQIGELVFGRPSRITARLHMGGGRVIDIEREVQLGGPIHSKGVLILSSYLAAHYANDRPLSLSASLVFEQSYGGVDGDSASSAELYALLSALSDVPLKQSFAVTGSVNQYGEVQAIGGVNEKIEGFYDICHARGLTGHQGVLIPNANVKHLMLRADIVDAVAAGQFAIYPVSSIDEGLALLTGLPAGEKRADGTFTPDSVNERARLRLIEYAERRREFAVVSDDPRTRSEPKPDSNKDGPKRDEPA